MKCPFCHSKDSKVIDSRDLREGESIRRRRECLKCNHRFTTYERVEPISILVVKKDGSREEFNRQKLSKGLITAFTKRPVRAEQIEQLIDEVEAEIFRNGELEILSHYIGELVIEKLRRIDAVAYIRFASVYHEFADLEVMRSEMDKLISNRHANTTGGKGDVTETLVPKT